MSKLCHIITTFYDTAGSSKRTLLELCHQSEKGHEVHLIVGRYCSRNVIDKCSNQGIRVFKVDSLFKYVDVKLDLHALKAIFKILRNEGYDLVHTHLAKAGILGRLAAKIAGTKVIIHTVHGPSFPKTKGRLQRSLFLSLERIVGRFTDAMVFVGREIQDEYLLEKVIPRERAYLIYTGRDFSEYEKALTMSVEDRERLQIQHGIRPSDIITGYVARTVPSKGHIFAIEVCRSLIKDFPNLKMLFIGKANLPSEQHHKEKLQKMVTELGLEGTVLFIDYQHEIAKYYAIMDAFILPSYYEGLPNVVIEAVAMGMPVVAFDCGGVREVFELCPNAGGHIVPVKDTVELTRRLSGVLKERCAGNKRRASFNCLEVIKDNWSIEQMLRQTDALYDSLLTK